MARERATFGQSYRNKRGPSIVADVRREFRGLTERHEVFRLLGAPKTVLEFLKDDTRPSQIQGAILRALALEIKAPKRCDMAFEFLIYAFAPTITSRYRTGAWDSSREDFEQESILCLLETITETPLPDAKNQDLSATFKRAIARGLMAAKYEQRKEFLRLKRFHGLIRALRPEDIGCGKAKIAIRLRFEPEIRHGAKVALFDWVGRNLADDPRMDPWVAIMIDGEPVRDYVRRVFSTNDDAEITRLANLARKHKERIGNEIRWTLGDTTKARRSRHPAEFLDQQAAGSGRKEKKLRSVMTATQDRNADRREEDRKQKGSRPKWAKRPQGDCKGIEESKQ